MAIIAERDPAFASAVRDQLLGDGFVASMCTSAHDALAAVRKTHVDLLIAHVDLPDLDGVELCRRVKGDASTRHVAVLLTSDARAPEQAVAALEQGASGFVARPFGLRELLLRARIAVRQRGAASPRVEPIRFGVLAIDRAAHRVLVEGDEVRLTAAELRLLVVLYEGRGAVQTRERLIARVWNGEDVSPRTVDQRVRRLRARLGAAARYVRTVRDGGYEFVTLPEGVIERVGKRRAAR